jgi:mRNA interferase MazF
MNIRQSEVWLVNFFPKVGSEISKERPAIVVSHDEIGRLPLKIIVPVTDWKPNYAHYPWMVRVENSVGNGLSKVSAIDCFQVKNFANQRFVKKLGSINDDILKIAHSTIAKALNPAYVLKI